MPDCRPLVASQVEPVGQVCVALVEGGADVRIELAAGYFLRETRVAVAATLEGFPTSESGVPRLGLFPHSSVHQPPVVSTSHRVPLEDFPFEADGELLFSVHASVVGADQVEHGAWVEGRRFREPGMPATYFAVAVGGPSSGR